MVEERDLRWKTVASKSLFKENWLNIRVDTCEKPDGSNSAGITGPNTTVWNYPVAV